MSNVITCPKCRSAYLNDAAGHDCPGFLESGDYPGPAARISAIHHQQEYPMSSADTNAPEPVADLPGGRELSDKDKDNLVKIEAAGLVFLGVIGTIATKDGGTRELSLAKTKIEEAVFWATKSITK
jgi:hypothetical protein